MKINTQNLNENYINNKDGDDQIWRKNITDSVIARHPHLKIMKTFLSQSKLIRSTRFFLQIEGFS